jgi:helicase
LDDFATWFNMSSNDLVDSNWRPSLQRIARFEWNGDTGVIRYSSTEGEGLLSEFVPGVIRRRTFEYLNPETRRWNRPKYPDTSTKSETAVELAFKFAELGPTLIFCAQTNWAESVGKSFLRRLDLEKLLGNPLPSHYDTGTSRAAAVASEWLGSDHICTRLLSHGVSIHHGGLPDAVRSAIEADFRDHVHRVIIATNTLAQGVNLPLRNVIFHSTSRSVETASGERTMDPIPARDYWNIAGRAGRARHETEGTVIHIVKTAGDRAAFEQYLSARKDLEPVESGLLTLLRELVDGRLTEAAAESELDPEVLALLVEEAPGEVTNEWVDRVLGGTLFKIQAENAALDMGPIRSVMATTARQVLLKVPDESTRQVYSSTGLRSDSCEILRQIIMLDSANVERLLRTDDTADRGELATLVIQACSQLDEMQPDRDFGGSHEDLLGIWMEGTDLATIRRSFPEAALAPEELGKFIETYFGYRLPWGIAAYLRIARGALGIDAEPLGKLATYFPAMVKFGVPFPEATWPLTSNKASWTCNRDGRTFPASFRLS